MGTAISGAIIASMGVIIGYGINLIGNYMNNKAQQKREEEKFERDIYIKEKEEQYKSNKDRIAAIVEIIELLNYFEYSVSLTSSCIDTTKKLCVTEHDNTYRNELTKLHRLVSLISVYTPDYYNYIRTIEGNHSVYWGRQRTLLMMEYENDKEIYRNTLNAVVKTAQECSKNISDLMYKLRLLSENLQSPI